MSGRPWCLVGGCVPVELCSDALMERGLLLASASPRRRVILDECGVRYLVKPPGDVQESEKGRPREVAVGNARLKLRSVLESMRGASEWISMERAGWVGLGVDTVVVADGEVLGKPSDPDDAARMLRMLSGRAHEVLGGVALYSFGRDEWWLGCACTEVRFRKIGEEWIEWYVGTGEPLDKAGGYGIQGRGRLLVESVCGCYYNVVGLPLGILVKGVEKLECSFKKFFANAGMIL